MCPDLKAKIIIVQLLDALQKPSWVDSAISCNSLRVSDAYDFDNTLVFRKITRLSSFLSFVIITSTGAPLFNSPPPITRRNPNHYSCGTRFRISTRQTVEAPKCKARNCSLRVVVTRTTSDISSRAAVCLGVENILECGAIGTLALGNLITRRETLSLFFQRGGNVKVKT